MVAASRLSFENLRKAAAEVWPAFRHIFGIARPREQASLVTGFLGADERNRTSDLLITNQLLYQLSYISDRQYFNKPLAE